MDTGTIVGATFVAASAMLCVVLWIPYIGARAFVVWGLADFLKNYTEGFPAVAKPEPLWATRAHRAHLNLVETLPAFVGVVWAASATGAGAAITTWAPFFFWARVLHAIVYVAGVPYLRTPVYLASWFAVLMIGVGAVA